MANKEKDKNKFLNQSANTEFEYFLDNPLIPWDYGVVLIKDKNHKFIASNLTFSKFSGIHPYDLVGQSDHDMVWNELSHIYINHEKDILAGHHYSVIEPLAGLEYANLLTKKDVIFNKKGIPSGTAASAIIFNKKIEYANLSGRSSSVKVSDYFGYTLTRTESIVLYYLLKGFSRGKIAELSNITKSSYDFHIRNIKQKFNVSSVDDVVFICYNNNLHDVVPFSVLALGERK